MVVVWQYQRPYIIEEGVQGDIIPGFDLPVTENFGLGVDLGSILVVHYCTCLLSN